MLSKTAEQATFLANTGFRRLTNLPTCAPSGVTDGSCTFVSMWCPPPPPPSPHPSPLSRPRAPPPRASTPKKTPPPPPRAPPAPPPPAQPPPPPKEGVEGSHTHEGA